VVERSAGRERRARGEGAPGDELLVAQQLDARVVARLATRRGLQCGRPELEPAAQHRVERARERLAVCVAQHGLPVALELVAGHAPVPGARVQPARGDLGEQRARGVRHRVQQAVGPRLVRGLVAREAHVAMLAEYVHVAAELEAQVAEHALQRFAHLVLVRGARGLEVAPRVVAFEALEPRDRARPEAFERHARTA
jgi:hypothetical protein